MVHTCANHSMIGIPISIPANWRIVKEVVTLNEDPYSFFSIMVSIVLTSYKSAP